MDLAPAQPRSALARYRILSPKAGVRVSPLQLGAMSIGDAWKSWMGSLTKDKAFELLDAFVAEGGNFIDTSNNYQDEQSETWIGEWMKARGNRDQLVIATKFTTDYRMHELGKNNAVNSTGNSKRSMTISLRDSLAKLQTDWVDILYLHWWDYTTSIEEVMDGLDILVKSGKVLYLGISDAPAWVAAAANTYAIAHGKAPFVIYQGRWNVLRRDFERDILPMARTFGLALAPWDVLGGGRFKTTKQVEKLNAEGEALRATPGIDEPGQTPEEAAISEALEKVAGELGTDSITAVALAYVMAKAPSVFPIVGGRRVEHLKDNIKALNLRLSPEQIKYLEGVKPFEVGFPHNMLGAGPGQSVFLTSSSVIDYTTDVKPVGY